MERLYERYGKRAVAGVTLACFLLSTVAVPAMPAAGLPDTGPFERLEREFVLPYSLGRITGAHYSGSSDVAVLIQDLHCHPEVQKNIAEIIAALDGRFGIDKVYLEGGTGPVDTSWLSSIRDAEQRKTVVASLMAKGELTGAEYFAVTADRPNLLFGLEDRQVYDGNVLRFARIRARQDEIGPAIGRLREKCRLIEEEYCGEKNKRLGREIARYRAGGLDTAKFYGSLERYAGKSGIDFNAYENLASYLALLRSGRELRYSRVSSELQRFLQVLKQRLPYTTYRSIAEKTGNFSKLDELYLSLARLARDGDISGVLEKDFPALSAFFRHVSLNRKINPLALVAEERKLIGDLRLALSESESEREVVFLAGFLDRLEVYYTGRISADDRDYYDAQRSEFDLIWDKYAESSDLAVLDRRSGQIDDYYRVNTERNSLFLKRLSLSAGAAGPVPRASGDNLADALDSLDNGGKAVVAVTGGFHTPGLAALLEARGISYIVITPNVTRETDFSDAVYSRVMEEQARLLDQALAPDPNAFHERKLAGGLIDAKEAESLADGAAKPRESPLQSLGRNVTVLLRRVVATFEGGRGISSFDLGQIELLQLIKDSSIDLGDKYFYLLAGSKGEKLISGGEEAITYGRYIERIREKFKDIGFKIKPVDVVLSKQTRRFLISPDGDSYGLGTLRISPITGRLTAVIHRRFFQIMEIFGPLVGKDENELIDEYVTYEGLQYNALNDRKTKEYAAFTKYISGLAAQKEGKEVSGEALEAYRSAVNFQGFIRHLSALPENELGPKTSLLSRLAALSLLLDFTENAVLIDQTIRFFERSHGKNQDLLIKEAVRIAASRYGDRAFPSGEKYLHHALSVARDVAKWGADEKTITAAILHKLTQAEWRDIFSKQGVRQIKSLRPAAAAEITGRMEKLLKISKLPYVDGMIAGLRGGLTLQNYMNMIVQLAGDDQTMLLVFADSLQRFPGQSGQEERDYRRQEIEHVFVPLAMRLDAVDIMEDLRNGAFYMDDPEAFIRTRDLVEEYLGTSYEQAELMLEDFSEEIAEGLKDLGIEPAVVKHRAKTTASVWGKVSSDRRKSYKGKPVRSLKDILGLQIIVDESRFQETMDFVDSWLRDSGNGFHNILPAEKDEAEQAEKMKSYKSLPIVPDHNKDLDRFRYNFADWLERSYELCIYGADSYAHLQSGFLDETSVKSLRPHWIYKLGEEVRSESEEGLYIRKLTFRHTGAERKTSTDLSFRGDNMRPTGSLRGNFKALHDSLAGKMFVMFYDDKQRLGVVALPDGAAPADLAAHLDVDLFDKNYSGLDQVFLVKHGENPVRAEKLPHALEEKAGVLRTGDMVAARAKKRDTSPTPSYLVIRNAKTPRAIILAAMSQMPPARRKTQIENGKRMIIKKGSGKVDDGTWKELAYFSRSKGLWNLDELYFAVSQGIIDTDEITQFLRQTSQRVVQLIGQESTLEAERQVTEILEKMGFRVTKRGMEYVDQDTNYFKFIIDQVDPSVPAPTNGTVESELFQLQWVGSVEVKNTQPLYLSAQALGRDLYSLLVSIYGIRTVTVLASSLQELLVKAFNNKTMWPDEIEAAGYGDDVRALEELVSGLPGGPSAHIVVSRNPDLMQKDAWAMATMEVRAYPDAPKGTIERATLFVHEEFFRALKSRAPPERREMLRLLVEHEFAEHRALHVPGSPEYEAFTAWLRERPDGVRNQENFHAFILHLNTKENLSAADARLAGQTTLLEWASEAARPAFPAGWQAEYARLIEKHIDPSDARTRDLLKKVIFHYRDLHTEDFKRKIREIAELVDGVPGVEDVYGLGYPFYGPINVVYRNYTTLKAVEDGTGRLSEFAQRTLPDIDLLLVLAENEEGPWSVGGDIDSKMMQVFLQQAGWSARQWRKVFDRLSSEYNIVNKFSDEGDRDPIDLFLEKGKLSIDFVPVAKHVWVNMPVMVLPEDIKKFKVIRDLLFTSAPLASVTGDDFTDIPFQFRRNFLLNIMAEARKPLTKDEIVNKIIELHPYRALIDTYGDTRSHIFDIFGRALDDAESRALVSRGADGAYALTEQGERFLSYIYEKRRAILEQGYFDMPPYGEGMLAAPVSLRPEADDEIEAARSVIRRIQSGGHNLPVIRDGLIELLGLTVETPEGRRFVRERLNEIADRLLHEGSRNDDLYNLVYAFEVTADRFDDVPNFVPREYEATDGTKFEVLLERLMAETGRNELSQAEKDEVERFCAALDEIPGALAPVAADVRYPNLCGPSAQVIVNILEKYGLSAMKYVFTGYGFAQTCVQVEIAGFSFYVDGTAGHVINSDGRRIAPVVTPHRDVIGKKIGIYLSKAEGGEMKKEAVRGWIHAVDLDAGTAGVLEEVRDARLRIERVEHAALAAGDSVPAGPGWTRENAPEAYGKAVLRYFDDPGPGQMAETAALNHIGMNAICVTPLPLSDDTVDVGKVTVVRPEGRKNVRISAGRVEVSDGRSFGFLYGDGLEPADTERVAAWLKGLPERKRREIAGLLGSHFDDIDVRVVEAASDRSPSYIEDPDRRAMHMAAGLYRERIMRENPQSGISQDILENSSSNAVKSLDIRSQKAMRGAA